MNKQWLDGMWELMRQKYGIYLRVLEAIPAERFHDRPIPGMRTPAQMVVHTSGSIIRDIAEGVASGSIEADEAGEDAVAEGLETKDEVIGFARKSWKLADAAVTSVGDDELNAEVLEQVVEVVLRYAAEA